MLTKTAAQAQDIKAGDDVVSMGHGRLTVASVEQVGASIRLTSTRGLSLTVSPRQLFFRYEH